MAKLNLLGKVSTFGVAVALSAMMVPAVAMADEPENSTTGPDNVVVVKWTENGTDFSCNVDLDAITHHTDRMGALYKKGSSAFTVLGTNEYVTLQDVLESATKSVTTVDPDDEDETITTVYKASDVWDYANDRIVFDVWNDEKDSDGNVIGKIVETYSKYASGYTKAKLEGYNNFCGDTTAQALVVDENDDDNPAEYADGAILALRSNTASITGENTAQQTLENMDITSTSNSPRLMWGHEDGNTAGNRFPSNIDVITVIDAGSQS